MDMIAFLLTLWVLCTCNNNVLVNADEEGYGDDLQSQGEEKPPTMADMLTLCFFSTFCYGLLLGPFLFGPRLKREIEAFKLHGVATEATLLSQSIDDNYDTILLVRFTNTKGQRIEKEMHVNNAMLDDIERENLKTVTIYNMPDNPFSASLGDGSHEDSFLAKLLCGLGGVSLAGVGVYCFVVYFTYFSSIPGFVGMIVMHVAMAVGSYLASERLEYHAKVMEVYEGGSVVFGDDPAPMLGVGNTATSAGQNYNAMA
jgi:hypothetical protein